MADPKWKKRLIPVLPEAVSALARIITGNLMDELFSKEVLTSSIYDEMIKRIDSDDVDKSKSARTLFQFLRRCASPSFDDFCSTLTKIEGGDTLLKLLASSCGHNTEEKLGSCGEPQSVIATSTEGARRIFRPKKSKRGRKSTYCLHKRYVREGVSRYARLKRLYRVGTSREVIRTGAASVNRVFVHVHKAFKEEFQPYRSSVERFIRDVTEARVKFRFLKRLPVRMSGKPRRRQKVRKGERRIEIPLQCVLRIYLPNTNKKGFLKEKKRLLRAIPSLLGHKKIEIHPGSCDVYLTLRGIDLLRFVSDLQNSRVLIAFIQLDTDTEIQFGKLQSIKVTRLFKLSPLLQPVAGAFSTIKQLNKTTEKDREAFSRSYRLSAAYYSLDEADDCLKCEQRLNVVQTTLEETARVQCKPSFASLETEQCLRKKLAIWSESICNGLRRSEAVERELFSTIRRVDKMYDTLHKLAQSRQKKSPSQSEANFSPSSLHDDGEEEEEEEAFLSPRHGHVAALIENRMLLWGGMARLRSGKDDLCSNKSIMSFNLCMNKWSKRKSTWVNLSDVPVPSTGASVAVVNDRYVYHYGGVYSFSDDSVFCDDLHKLDVFTLKWKKIALASGSACPTGRAACGMCALGSKEDRHLVMTSGCGKSGVSQVSSLEWSSPQSSNWLWNNELWLFSVNKAIWIPVACIGKSPSPRSAFSFTAIDDDRALLVGGADERGVLGDAFVFKLSLREWSKILLKGPASLRHRMFHSTVVCNIPYVGPTAFVLWGRGKDGNCISSGHRIALDTFECTKVLTRNEAVPTREQTTCCFLTKSEVFFFRFGGLSTVGSFQLDSDSPFNILRMDLNNFTEELFSHDSKRPICRFVPAIVSSTYKDLPDQLSPRDVNRVSALLGSRWTEVARAVFPIFSEEEMRIIKTGFPTDPGLHFLFAWLANNREATRQALCRALFEADLSWCVAEVFPDNYSAMTKMISLDFLPRFQRNELVYDEDDDFIDEGWFGNVFKAKLTETGKEDYVAVKVFPIFQRRESENKIFENEAAVLSCIEPHPHVLRLIGVCTSPRHFAVVTEFVSGGNLHGLLISGDEAIRRSDTRIGISRQIALGMAHLHYNYPPVIHLDLNPRNILVERVGGAFVCKVADFGLSKVNDGTSFDISPCGSLLYVAPERYRKDIYGSGRKQQTLQKARKADVYSYGVVVGVIFEYFRPDEDSFSSWLQSNKRRADATKLSNHLLNSCVEFRLEDRPTFRTVILIFRRYALEHE